MNKAFLILDKNHLGDISLLIGFVCGLLISFYAVGVGVTDFIRINGFSLGSMWPIWESTFSNVLKGMYWIGSPVLVVGAVLGLIGLFEKEQNKTKAIAG